MSEDKKKMLEEIDVLPEPQQSFVLGVMMGIAVSAAERDEQKSA